MRRIFPSVSAASARAILVSAAILTGTSFFPVQAQHLRSVSSTPDMANDEVSFAQVRSSLNGGNVGFPHPLSAENTVRYRAIFRALREGNLERAAKYTDLLQDKLLLSDVLAERYLRFDARPTQSALKEWLKAYPHSPDAPLIEDLLASKFSSNNTEHHREKIAFLKRGADASDFVGLHNNAPSMSQYFTRNISLEHNIQEMASRNVHDAYAALVMIREMRGINDVYKAHLYGDVALTLLSQGHGREALRIGAQGFDLYDKKVGFPAFVAGLSAWHEGEIDSAYFLLETAANSKIIDGDIEAAASFWAARIELKRHKIHAYHAWLHRAASHHSSFYGLLAQEVLKNEAKDEAGQHDIGARFIYSSPNLSLGEIDIETVMSMTEGRHLFALLQIGEQGRAEALMRRMWPDYISDSARARSLQLVAQAAGLREVSMQMKDILDQLSHQNLKETIGKLPHLQPKNGFHFDPALVYAVAHTESNFNPEAQSSVGAMGMMQIRPRTASFVTTKHVDFDTHGLAIFHVPANMQRRLCDPAYNLEVGQLYMLYLADAVSKAGGADTKQGGDLLRVLASYNAGPQAIVHWENLQDVQHDPLYFVETLPNMETRQYVHKVMTSTWLYARHMGLAVPSLSALSQAKWPSFVQEKYVQESPS